MTAMQLAWAHLKHRMVASVMIFAIITLAIGTIVGLDLFTRQLDSYLKKSTKNIDLVVGIEKTPSQLARATLFHFDVPMGDMPLGMANRLRKSPLVSWSVPLVMADSFRGYRIVGTEQKFSFLFDAELETHGSFWGTPFDVVLGSTVAARTGLRQGDRFHVNHGLVPGGREHSFDYVVTGVLQPTGGAIDRLILTAVQTVWDTHNLNDEARGVTALLVRYAVPQSATQLPALAPTLQVARPDAEAVRLFDQVNNGLQLPQLLAWLSLLAAVIGLLAVLRASLPKRRDDIAIQRVMGASPRQIFWPWLLEGILPTTAGALCGVLLAHLGLAALARLIPLARDSGMSGLAFAPVEILLLLATPLLGTLAALWPARLAARVEAVDPL